ncbi:uncharacterized protein LOC112511811 isoform X2 [Cynara cardunculus var. scolymus]|uniref:uncharacterized protein LOC112511811 isoform X2 n=1 Tax=Cynara cardunculus var. scolymus TaxID=59895 RepID=UPI000D62568F|nr:uncharacterized protein LOC112511811 isoform X2 [Cynara cardunculus var. scolymus]
MFFLFNPKPFVTVVACLCAFLRGSGWLSDAILRSFFWVHLDCYQKKQISCLKNGIFIFSLTKIVNLFLQSPSLIWLGFFIRRLCGLSLEIPCSLVKLCNLDLKQSKACPKGRERFSTTATDNAEGGNEENQNISVTFVDKDGEEKKIKVPIGMSMLEAAHENDIELEGACEGSLACSTCHVIVMDVEHYNKLEDPTDEENDMLDLAFGLTETCMQVTSGLSSNCKT